MDRITCAVPGCRRSHHNREGFAEWICAKHWAAVPKRMRSRHSLYKRRGKKVAAWQLVADRMWIRCRDEAIGQALSGGWT
jgi:hypothetical protein